MYDHVDYMCTMSCMCSHVDYMYYYKECLSLFMILKIFNLNKIRVFYLTLHLAHRTIVHF